ncbi:MAG: glycosyltransferase family 4 protein [Verrucomicrobia bacterium]|nr:glycosyltransferase family 4 protein [Verrucomicrobiota bacterium]
MRILFVHERLGAWGGAEANALVTAAELRRRGHCVGLAHGASTGRGEAAWQDTFEARFPLPPGASAAALEEAVRTFQPEVVYLHKMADLDVIAALADGRVPVVRMVHDHDLYCMRSYKYDYFTRAVCHRPVSLACLVPCLACVARNPEGRWPLKWVSYRAKQRELRLNRCFARLVVATRYMERELVQNGFAPDRIRLHAPVPRSGDPGVRADFGPRNLLIYAGQIIRGKGVDVLLESLAQVQAPFELLVLGEGNHRPHCEQLAQQLGLGGKVRFAGFVPQDELKRHYAAATAMVMSSLWPEPMGAVGLEAMRYGLPVVAFDAGGIGEWLHDGENGFLVPWSDRRAYAARVDQLLTDKDLARRLGAQALRFVTERFHFDTYIDGLEALFAETAALVPRATAA